MVRRHDVERLRSSFLGHRGMLFGIEEALADNRRDHGELSAQLVGDDARDVGAFARRQ
jgi:hypothetical protein